MPHRPVLGRLKENPAMKLSPATQVHWTVVKTVAVAMALAAAPAVACSSSSSPAAGSGPDASGTTDDGGEMVDGTAPSGDGASASSDAHTDGHADAHTTADGGQPDAGGDAPAGATGVASLCAATCNRLATCSGTTVTDAAACTCSASATGSQFYLYRSDYVAAVTSCVSAETCSQFLGDAGSPDCVTSALGGITASAEVGTLCMAIGNSTCPSDATTDCPDTFKPYSDVTLAAVSACIADPTCSNHTTCLEAALGQ